MRISKKLRADIVKIYARISLDYERADYFKEHCNNMEVYKLWLARASAKWDVLEIILQKDFNETAHLVHKIVREHKRLVE